MKHVRGFMGLLVALAVFAGIMATGGEALAYTLSGTVTNATTKSGRVYISVGSSYGGSNGQGVSIVAPASGQSAPFTIRGVPAGYYVVRAFMDTRNTGTQHANDPAGASGMVSVTGDTAGAAIQLANPAPVAVQSPAQASALPMGGGALVNWDPPTFDNQSSNSSLEIADSYNIYRQSVAQSATTCPTDPAGYSLVRGGIPASDDDIWLQRGLTDGTTWCYQVTAVLGGNESAPSPPSDPVTIGALPGGHTVSGTVAFPGITPTGPLYVAIYSDSAGIFLTRVDNPVSPQQFTVPGVQDGAYQVYAVLDQNDNGVTDDGDVTVSDRQATAVTVSGAAVQGVAATLQTASAGTWVGTGHRQSQSGETYDLRFGVFNGVKRPVNVALVSGQGVDGPVDLALRDRGSFEYWLNDVARPVPQTQQYAFDIAYADGTSEQGVLAAVSGVLDSFPVPLAPKGRTTYAPQPTFTWAPPQTLPSGPYMYQLRLEGNMSSWDTDRIPAGTTSMQYNADGRAYQPSLADNSTYTWQVTVEDAQGNQARSEAVFFFGGSISGKVTDAGTQAGISGIYVRLYDGNGNNMPWNYQATTDADGRYVIGGLTSGAYRVCFDTYQTDYIGRCYNIQEYNSYNAANIPVTSPNDTPDISVALTKGGSVSGTVTAAGGVGIAGAWVELRDPQGYGVPGTSTAYTDASGAYTIRGVPAGTYTVWFNGGGSGYVGAWYRAPGETQSATQITVATGATVTGISGVLSTGGSITGTVTSGGGAVAGVQVELRDLQGNWLPDGKNTQTGSDGKYTLQGVSPGSYTVYFNGAWAGYIGQWYNGQASAGSATPVAVAAGQTVSGIDAVLLQGGSISGKVTDLNGGTGIAGISVQLYDGQGMGIPGIWGTMTQADGTYSVKGLTSGTYKVCFFPGSTSYIGGCYNQQALMPWSATPVTVTAPNDTPNINGQLTTGGTITGRVTKDGTDGIPEVRVELRDQNGNWVPGVNNVTTSPDGSYTLGGIPTGSYKLFFRGNQAGFISEWHNDQPTAEQAAPIGIVAGQTVPGVNAILAPGATITGTVTDANTGLGIAGIQVDVTDTNGYGLPEMWGLFTAGDGTYSVKGLASGSYRVCFSSGTSGYIGKCYNNKAQNVDADPVSVTVPNITANINASLNPGGSVAGRVTAGGQGLMNVWVELKDTNGNYVPGVNSAMTDAGGNYSLGGIPAGTYTLYFNPGPGAYVGQWYNGKLSVESADRITLASGQKLADIDVVLLQGGSIGGTISGPQGGAAGVNVQLYDAAGLPTPFNAYTWSDGTYSFTGVPAGSYKLFVNAGMSGLVSQWYNGKLTAAGADPVVLAPGQDLTGVNLTLAQGGYLAGHVRNSGNSPIAGVAVQVFDANGTLLPVSGTTDSFGNYYLGGLPAGDVKVFFNADQAGYYSQWNNFKANVQAADPVTVTAGNTVNLADATLMSKQTSTTSLTIAPNPAVYGQSVTVTARVAPAAAAGGKVQFRLNNANWGEAVDLTLVNGTATAVRTTASLPATAGGEPHAVTAEYLGAADLAPSGTLPVLLTVSQAASSIALASSNEATTYGQPVTVTATVTIQAPGSGTPTGTVTFRDGQNIIGTGTLNGAGQATLTLSSLSAGVHALTAVYGGDTNVTGSTSGGIVQTVGKAGTAVTLSSSVNPSNNGQSVTFTATLAVAAPGGGTPTGVVTFMDGATLIGTGTLDASGQASFTTATLAAGDHGINAVYPGDASFTGSSSTQLIQTVVQPQAKLEVTVTGGGSGSVHSAPAGIACTGGTCPASFDLNAQVTLTATTDNATVFTGWSGACGGTDDTCVVTMNGDKGVTATFAAAARVKIGSTSYPTLQNAFDQAAGGATVRALGVDFTENLTLGAAKGVTLVGGYDPSYLSLTGWTSIHGVLKIGLGQLIVERVKVW
jgi:uncharacterized protein (DUF2141 family)